jgi:hypothetical protein
MLMHWLNTCTPTILRVQGYHLVSCIEVHAGDCQELSDNFIVTLIASIMQRCLAPLQTSDGQWSIDVSIRLRVNAGFTLGLIVLA